MHNTVCHQQRPKCPIQLLNRIANLALSTFRQLTSICISSALYPEQGCSGLWGCWSLTQLSQGEGGGGGVTPRHPHSHSHPIHSSQLAWCVRQNPRTPKENILNPAQEGTGSEAQTHNLLDGGDPPTFWMKIPAFRGRFSRCNQSSVWKFKLLTIMEFVIAPVRRVWSVS